MEKAKHIRAIAINNVCVDYEETEIEQFGKKDVNTKPSDKELEKIKNRDIISELKKRSKS